MQADNSKQYNTFIDSYNQKFNEFANNLAASFFDRINVDKDIIKTKGKGLLQKKFEHIDAIMNDKEKNNYDKLKLTGAILSDVTTDLMNSDPEIKKSGVNIINSFFEVARKTEDSELLQTALSISKSAGVKTVV